MTLLDPSQLSLLLLVPLFMGLFVWRNAARQRALSRLGDAQLVQSLVKRVSPRLRLMKSALWLLALSLTILALARPSFGSEQVTTDPIGAQVVFIMDTSLSMDAQDVAPSRLVRAQLDAVDLAQQLEGSSLSIVLFAGIATRYMPETLDVRVASLFLEALTTDALQVQGTALAAALTIANTQFDTNPDTPAIIVIFSDGEDHQGDLDVALQAAQQANITIYTLGYGTEGGAPIPLRVSANQPAQFKQDAGGGIVLTRLQSETLQRLASDTGGQYRQATSVDDLVAISDDIKTKQGGALTPQTIERPAEQFQLPLLVAIVCLALSILVPQSRRADA